MNRIEAVFQKCRAEGRAAFIAYLCAGDPDPARSLEACRLLARGGVDLLELGVPFSDPLADGLTNQLAAQRALEAGSTQRQVFAQVKALRAEFPELPIVLYTYYNLVFSRGHTEYARLAREAGADGTLTLDLPPEEGEEWIAASREAGLANIFIVAPTTPPERMAIIASAASGFIYYVSRLGVTGERDSLAAGLDEKVARIKEHTSLPVAVGFGISRPGHVREVAALADGVVVGSALVNCIAHNLEDPDRMLATLKERLDSLRGALDHPAPLD